MTPQDKKTLLQYFDPRQPFDFMGSSRYSTLVAGLRDCRVYTKRDVSTGKHNSEIKFGNEGNWLGAIGYFTVLDQIGSCYRPLGVAEPQANAIKFAIEQFAYDLIGNDARQLNALIALRNAFTHDFNLLNVPRDANLVALQQHKFTVTADAKNSWTVKLPAKQWDGNIDGKDFYDTSDTTFVNLFAFGNLVESVYSKIYDLINKDQIDLRLPTLRLINRYTFVTSDHPIK